MTPEELLELAWGVIANAYGGDWDQASDGWRGAAERWRDNYHEWLPGEGSEPAEAELDDNDYEPPIAEGIPTNNDR